MTLPALIYSGDMLPGMDRNLNGRRWTTQQLLRNWALLAGDQTIHIGCLNPADLAPLEPILQKYGHRGSLNPASLLHPHDLAAVGGLFLPDPQLGRWAAWRQAVGHHSFSLIGQIHTLSTRAAMGLLDALVVQPVQAWDALICSSEAGRQVVMNLIEDREQQLGNRLGAVRFPRPQLPVIPLPLPQESFEIPFSRPEARQALGLNEQDSVVLWLGRLSLLTKADLWASYRALSQVARQLPRRLVLIECGPDDTPEQASHLASLRASCPQIAFLRLGGREPVSEARKQQALAASDLALSLVDNTQETFGLAVAEAMAGGLPVVASNWNGYRDLVRDGLDGFLVPCQWSPAASIPGLSAALGWSLELELQSYPGIAGSLAQLVQVDVAAASAAITLLLNEPMLARRMGQAARLRALEQFTMANVTRAYCHLFEELAELRHGATGELNHCEPPIWLDPVRCFSHYPSGQWAGTAATEVPRAEDTALVEQGRQQVWQQLRACCPEKYHPALTASLGSKHGTIL